MKKHIIILIGALAINLTSCTGLLEQDPISQFSAENVYKTKDQAKAGVNGIYTHLQNVMRINFAYWGEGRADNVAIKHTGEPTYLLTNQLTPLTTSSADWGALYTLISSANYAIKYIPNVYEADSEEGNRLIGEAKALRGLAYFYLVKIWGDVPLIIEPYISSEQELFVTKTDKELVLDRVELDMKFASENCSANVSGNAGRATFTKGGANAVLTQVYLWRKKYNEVIATADLVIKNPMYSLATNMVNWSKIFTDGYQSESVFEVSYSDTKTNQLRVLFAIGSDAQYVPSVSFKSSFEVGDLRREYVYDVTNADPKAMWKYLGKDKKDNVSDPAKQSIIIVRLADVIMMKAEAMVKKNGATSTDLDNALNLLTPIRARAGLPSLTQTTAVDKYATIENAILHERRIELCYEGHRWFDLVRTGKAISTMGPVNGLSDVKNLVWPISQVSIDKNPNLVQNEYYIQ